MDHEHITNGTHSHEHTHSHSHEHTHDGQVHSHEHSHEHAHDHEHPHTHDHLHEHGHDHQHDHAHEYHHDREHDHHHHHEHSGAPMEQLCALVKYMVDHNAAHAAELAGLAAQLKGAGKEAAYEKVMSAVADFNRGNEMLANALREISAE